MTTLARLAMLAAVFAAIQPTIHAQAPKAAVPVVINFKNGEAIGYSTPLISGTLPDEKVESVTLTNASLKRPTREMRGLASKGRFKVLADLVPGENDLTIKAGEKSVRLKLVFTPQNNPYLVRAIYYTDNSGDAGFLSPVPNDRQDVVGKLSTAMLMMQSFTADRMQQHGYGRRTFNVELEPDGRVKVFIIKGDQAPNSGFNNGAVDRAIKTQAERPHTHYMVVLGRGCGYTAIGGNKKAFMGGGSIYSWPDSIKDAQAAFMDATPIDAAKFHADAIGRDVFWANTSTTVGACLHEIGHTFGLPHSMDGLCIMTRGHDYFNRFFTLIEPPSKSNAKPLEFKESDMARFCKVTANNLAVARFFGMTDREYSNGSKTEIVYDPAANEITTRSEIGIGFVGIEVPYANPGADYCVPIDPAKPAPKEIKIPAKDWARFGGKPFQIRVIDVDANVMINREPLKVK